MIDSSFLISLLSLIGATLLIRGVLLYKKSLTLKSWLPVSISIISAEVGEYKRPEVYVHIEYYLPKIKYEYKVADELIVSESVAVNVDDLLSRDRDQVVGILSNIGENRTGYYNPKNIYESVIIRETSRKRKAHYRALIGSGLLLLFLSFVAILSLN